MTSKGRLYRHQVARTIRRKLGCSAEGQEILAVKGTAETPAELVKGMRGIAGLLERLLKEDEALRKAFIQANVTQAVAEKLRAMASDIETCARDVDAMPADAAAAQRLLDIQDGVVLHIVDEIYRSHRDAQMNDARILLH